MTGREPQAYEEVREYLERSDLPGLRAYLGPLHPADIAEFMEGLETEEMVLVLKQLNNETAADVLAVVDDQSGQALLELLTDSEVVSLLEEMPSDDAADIISTLPPEKSKQVDALLTSDEREKLRGLLEFEEDTAGGIMEVEKVAVREGATIRDAIESYPLFPMPGDAILTGQWRSCIPPVSTRPSARCSPPRPSGALPISSFPVPAAAA